MPFAALVLEIRRAMGRGCGTGQKREHAMEPRLGERLDVSTHSHPVEHITSGKTFRSFGSLAPAGFRPVGLASEARSTGVHPGSWILAPLFLQLSPATRCTANETKFF